MEADERLNKDPKPSRMGLIHQEAEEMGDERVEAVEEMSQGKKDLLRFILESRQNCMSEERKKMAGFI